jgi:hypothetical protein
MVVVSFSGQATIGGTHPEVSFLAGRGNEPPDVAGAKGREG